MNPKSLKSNLRHVVNDLRKGDLVSVVLNAPEGGVYTVEGEVNTRLGAFDNFLRVGGVTIAHKINRVGEFVPAATVTEIAIVKRKALPFYSNAPIDRKPQDGDVVSTDGGLFYTNGILFYLINGGKHEMLNLSEFKVRFPSRRLRSEKVAA